MDLENEAFLPLTERVETDDGIQQIQRPIEQQQQQPQQEPNRNLPHNPHHHQNNINENNDHQPHSLTLTNRFDQQQQPTQPKKHLTTTMADEDMETHSQISSSSSLPPSNLDQYGNVIGSNRMLLLTELDPTIPVEVITIRGPDEMVPSSTSSSSATTTTTTTAAVKPTSTIIVDHGAGDKSNRSGSGRIGNRVLYRTANNETVEIVETGLPESEPSDSIPPIKFKITRNFLIKCVTYLLAFFVGIIFLEIIHYMNPCSNSLLVNGTKTNSFVQSWFSTLFQSQETSPLLPTICPCNETDILYYLEHENETLYEESKNRTIYLDENRQPFGWQNIRLPLFIHPTHYELYMNPSMDTFYNRGNVSIRFQLLPNTTSNFVVFHAKKLTITHVQIWSFGVTLNIARQQYCEQLEQYYVELDETQMIGPLTYRLEIFFERQLTDDLEGFYISSYHNVEHNVKRHLLTTHFEPTAARLAFPCFDEPALKATYKLWMQHNRNYTTFFNSRIEERIDVSDIDVVSESEKTVAMSTYLVAFVICDFATKYEYENRIFVHGIGYGPTIGTIAPPDQINHTSYAMRSARGILKFYRTFFTIDYPLPKLDMIAIPDFSAGAMENFGLITFRTTTLLYNEQESSSEMQEQVATVIAHEIAHQWFGNLVTMHWWSELWLNEGFASYVENLGVDSIHPEWRMLDQFVISTTQLALAMDSLITSHPIHADVENPADIEGIFDMISYKKGSCLIRMIENFLGKENLKIGLKRYLNKYAYSTANTSQLWESMSQTSTSLPFNVSTIMDTWVLQQGYPVINVRWGDDNETILVSQERFISSLGPEEFRKESKKTLGQTWIVPLTISIIGNSTSSLYWLNQRSMTIPFNRSSGNRFKLNYEQTGFYRVNYDQSMWRQLINELKRSQPHEHKISATDRSGLIDDALSLMRIGKLDVKTAMDLTRYLEKGEMDYVPWETILNHLGTLDSLMLQCPVLKRYILRLIRPSILRLGWKERLSDSMFEKKLRAIILRAGVFYGDRTAVSNALEFFKRWMNKGETIDANIRDIVYHAGIQYGSDDEWNYCWEEYLNIPNVSEKRLLLGALGSTRNNYLLWKYLNASLNRTLVRTQDTPFVIQNVARNPMGRTMAWIFIKGNWNYLLSISGSFSTDTIISESTWHFFTQYEHDMVEQFFSTVKVGSGRQSVGQSLEKIRANIYWKGHVESNMIRWLEKNAPK